jgi:hypothetical protein
MVTNFPNGVTNVAKETAFGEFPVIDPTTVFGQHLDFFEYLNDQWINTTVGSGAVNPSDEKGGVIGLTNSSADNDSIFLQWEGRGGTTNTVSEQYVFEAGKRVAFKTRFKINNVEQCDAVIGLQVTDTTPLSVTDGVYFITNDGVSTVDLVIVASSTATTVSGIATLVDGTYIELAYYYDGGNEVKYYVDGVHKGTAATTNLPTTELALSFGIQNGSAAAYQLKVDYITAYGER